MHIKADNTVRQHGKKECGMKYLISIFLLVTASANASELLEVQEVSIAERAINTLDNMATNFENQAFEATMAGNHKLAKTYSDQAIYIRIQAFRLARQKQNQEWLRTSQ
jgi:hypothetical protein